MRQGWKVAFLFCLAAAVSLVANPAAATGPFATHVFAVSMDGSQEVPPVVTGGTATVSVTLDDVSGAVTVFGNFSGLSSSARAAHIHGPAAPGMNAGILIPLSENGGTSGQVSGGGVLTPSEITDMLNGLHYINIHTFNHIAGEIRGQIVAAAPAMPWEWMVALVAAALLLGAFLLSLRQAAAATAA